jgi:hypothetical protein
MDNFELTHDELQELRKLQAEGYKTIVDGQKENCNVSPKCLFCQNLKINISSYAIDDNKKEIFVYSLCSNCLASVSLASLATKVSFQQILDRKIDSVLAELQGKKE